MQGAISKGVTRSSFRRARSRPTQGAAAAEADVVECPVCMERTVDDRSPVRSFGCSHVICNKCDDELFVRADDRCPTCRAPRTAESKASQMLDGASALRRSQAMMEGAENNPQPFRVFFPSVPVEELTIQANDCDGSALLGVGLIRPPSSGEDEAGDSSGLMVAASDHPIMQDPAIQHAVRALTSVGTISAFSQAVDTLRASGVVRGLRNPGAFGRGSSETTVRTYVVAHNAR